MSVTHDKLVISVEASQLEVDYSGKNAAEFVRNAFYPELINLVKATGAMVRGELNKGNPLKFNEKKLKAAADIYSKTYPLLEETKKESNNSRLNLIDDGRH